MSVAERLKKARGHLGKSQKDMAAHLGINYRTYENYEKSLNAPSWEACEAFAKKGYNANWLLTGEGAMLQGEASYQTADGLKTADLGGELGEGFVSIPRYEVVASAGGGAVVHSEQIVDHLSFKADWVRNALGVPVTALALINVTGDSMEPTLSDGDLILIDMSYKGVKDNSIYVLQLNGVLLVKRIQHKLDGSLVVKSDNTIYDPEYFGSDTVDVLNVIGRVVWCGRRM